MESMKKDDHPPILVVSGSTQKDGQSLKVATYLKVYLEKIKAVEANLLSLYELDLPAFGCQDKHEGWQAAWQTAEDQLKKAKGVILVSPEYNGSLSPAILNLMLYVGDNLSHKPILTVGVSAGRGGAYPLAALRQNGFKDPGYVIIPPSVIVSNVGSVLNDSQHLAGAADLTKEDNRLRQQLGEAVAVLLAYSLALDGVALFLAK